MPVRWVVSRTRDSIAASRPSWSSTLGRNSLAMRRTICIVWSTRSASDASPSRKMPESVRDCRLSSQATSSFRAVSAWPSSSWISRAMRVRSSSRVACSPHHRTVEPALVSEAVGVTSVEQLAPAPASGSDVVPEEVSRRHADKLRRLSAELLRHRRIHLGQALMGKDVVQHRILVDSRPPLDRLIEHHEEEPVLGALEERLQELGSVELGRFRQGCRHRVSWRKVRRTPPPRKEAPPAPGYRTTIRPVMAAP